MGWITRLCGERKRNVSDRVCEMASEVAEWIRRRLYQDVVVPGGGSIECSRGSNGALM